MTHPHPCPHPSSHLSHLSLLVGFGTGITFGLLLARKNDDAAPAVSVTSIAIRKLHEACTNGTVENVLEICENGIDVSAICEETGKTAVILACQNENFENACAILNVLSSQPGFDANFSREKDGRTAMIQACGWCNGSVVRCISSLPGFDHAACFGKKGTGFHETILRWVTNFRSDEDQCYDVLLACLDVLSEAVEKGALSKESMFQEYYGWDYNGQVPLFWLTENENRKATQLLLNQREFSILEQVRRIRDPVKGTVNTYEGNGGRWLLVNNISEGRAWFFEDCVRHLRRLYPDSWQRESKKLFDENLPHEPKARSTLMKIAVQMGHYSCVSALFLGGASTTMYDLVPVLVGPTRVEQMTKKLCEKVKLRFLDDVRDVPCYGGIEVVSVDVNSKCPQGTMEMFRSSLDVYRTKYGRSPTTRFLWHSSSVTDTVLESGLSMNFAAMDVNVYGAGLYLATDAKLSAAYTRPNDEGICSMLLVLTMLGTTGVREPLIGVEEESLEHDDLLASMRRMGVDLTQPQHRNPPIGCDSATGPHQKEIVVHNSHQTLPCFVVRYKVKKKVAAPPNPYYADTKSRWQGKGGKEYLRPLDDVSTLLSLEVEGLLDVREDARLLPMGTFPCSRSEARELRRRVCEDDYDARDEYVPTKDSSREKLWKCCSKMQQEIGWLKAQLGKKQLEEEEVKRKSNRLPSTSTGTI
jgi:hypothetical protein